MHALPVFPTTSLISAFQSIQSPLPVWNTALLCTLYPPWIMSFQTSSGSPLQGFCTKWCVDHSIISQHVRYWFFFLVRRKALPQFIWGEYTGAYLTPATQGSQSANLELLLDSHCFTPAPLLSNIGCPPQLYCGSHDLPWLFQVLSSTQFTLSLLPAPHKPLQGIPPALTGLV